jgi:hypothetical protein
VVAHHHEAIDILTQISAIQALLVAQGTGDAASKRESVSEPPDGITLERHVQLSGRASGPWLRRSLLLLIAALPVLALLNVFGQHPTTTSAGTAAVNVNVTAPSRLRSGLIFQVRVQVVAHRNLNDLKLAFDKGWWESMSVNSTVPEPTESTSEDGRVVFSYGKVAAGETHVSWVYFQTNPTNVGQRSENLEVRDGEAPLARLHRSVTVFP